MTNLRERATVRSGLSAFGCAAFVLAAIAAELAGGEYANSAVPGWAERLFPISWPQPVRTLWWLAVAGAALAYRLILHRVGIRQRVAVVAASVLPFVVFAAGVAFGADWATWH